MYKLKMVLSGCLLLVTVLFFLNSFEVGATSIQREKQEKRELELKKEEEEKKRKALKTERSKIEASIRELDKEAEGIVERLEVLGKRIAQNQKRIEILNSEISEADLTSKKHYDTMKRRIKYMYESGESTYLDLFLGSKTIEEILNKADYMIEIAKYDNTLFDKYLDSLAVLKEKKYGKEIEVKDLESNKAMAENELEKNKAISRDKGIKFKEYSLLIKETDAVITQFSGEIAEKEAHIDKLIALEEKRRKEAERLKRLAMARQNNTTGKISKSGFLWPLAGHSYISSGFGYRGVIIKGGGTFHNGIDIPAPIGTKISATLDGTVASAGYQYAMGNYVLLSHGDGLYTVYMHGSKLLVKSGDYVSKGQTIALVGSTGFSTGPHLHFGVKINGVYQNPMNYVSN